MQIEFKDNLRKTILNFANNAFYLFRVIGNITFFSNYLLIIRN